MNLSDSPTGGQLPRRVTAVEAVLTHLRGAIERGDYAVGDKLPSEAELASRFEVSRSVIREALRTLQALGFTVSRTGRGTFVESNGPADNPVFGEYSSRDLLEVRRHVEVPVARYAAVRRTAGDLDQLAHLLDRMDQETDPAAWVAMDTLFHIAIAQASGNPVFRRVIEEIRDALAHQSKFLNDLGGRRDRSNAEHRLIVEAIVEGSAEQAVEAMTLHLTHVETTLNAIVHTRADATRAEDDTDA